MIDNVDSNQTADQSFHCLPFHLSETAKNSRSDCSKRLIRVWGWSGGAMVLCKLLVPGRPTNLDYSRARAYCACSGCGWGLFGHFFTRLSFLFSFSLSLGDGPI